MINAAELLFMCLLFASISSLEKCLFKSFALFYNWVICLLLFTCQKMLVIYKIYKLEIFFPFGKLPFTFLMFLEAQNKFDKIKIIFIVFCFFVSHM